MVQIADKGDFLEITHRDSSRHKLQSTILHLSNANGFANWVQQMFDKYGMSMKIVMKEQKDWVDEDLKMDW